jgi:hypothetical protein
LAASEQQSTLQQGAKNRIGAQLAARKVIGEGACAAIRLAGAID